MGTGNISTGYLHMEANAWYLLPKKYKKNKWKESTGKERKAKKKYKPSKGTLHTTGQPTLQ